jgi:hypothetical protein
VHGSFILKANINFVFAERGHTACAAFFQNQFHRR